jgi:hypothetical protein
MLAQMLALWWVLALAQMLAAVVAVTADCSKAMVLDISTAHESAVV